MLTPPGCLQRTTLSSPKFAHAPPTPAELAALARVPESPSRPKGTRHKGGRSPRNSIAALTKPAGGGGGTPAEGLGEGLDFAKLGWGVVVVLLLAVGVMAVSSLVHEHLGSGGGGGGDGGGE